MNLEEAREKIDEIDRQLAGLFVERMELVSEVARYKKENNLPIYHSGREKEIVKNLQEIVPEEMGAYIKLLYSTMFEVSRAYQQKEYGESPLL